MNHKLRRVWGSDPDRKVWQVLSHHPEVEEAWYFEEYRSLFLALLAYVAAVASAFTGRRCVYWNWQRNAR